MALPLIQDNYQATVTDEVVSASATAVTLSVTPDSTRTTGHLYVFDTTGTLVEHVYYGARSSTQVSSMVRGLSLVTGADTAGTGVTWYRGYVVKMAPGSSDINPIKNVMNGTEAFPAVPKNPSTRTISDPRHHVDLEYLQAQTTSGVASLAVTKNGADPTATFNVAVGYLRVDGADVPYAGASAQPTVADATNYVYLTRAGALSKSVSAFPADTIPLVTLVVSGTADVSQATQDAAQPFGQAAASVVKAAQSFIAGSTGYVSASFYKRADTGSFTGTVTVSIQADSSGAPSGSSLASKTFTNAEWLLLPSNEKQTAIFSTPASGLTVTGLYWLVFEASTSDTSNCPNVGKITASAYAGGVLATYNGTSWSSTTSDLYFIINTAHSITSVTDRREILTSDVTIDEAAAIAGTSGTPSGSNKFVTNDDTSATAVAGKIPRYDANAKLPADVTVPFATNLVAGASITARYPVAIANDQGQTSSGDSDNSGNYTFTTTTDWRSAKLIVPTVSYGAITHLRKITLRIDGGGAGTMMDFSIRADSGGLPTGANIGSTVTVTADTTVGATITINFTDVPVASGSSYHLVMRKNAGSSNNPIVVFSGNAAGSSFDFVGQSSNSGGTWSALASQKKMTTASGSGLVDFYTEYAVKNADATSSGELADNIIGFAIAGYTAGQTVIAQLAGVVSGFTAGTLVPGKTYYLQNGGGIGLTAGSQSRKVGKATSDTELLITIDNT